MNADQIHAKIYAGRAKAALRLGLDYNVFRPTGTGNPLSNQVATIKAAFNAGDNTYKSPNMPGDAFWYGDFDGRLTQPGDYLVHPVNPMDVKYIAAQQQLLPIICIDCNRTVRLSRAAPQGAPGAVGAVGYSGLCDSPTESVDVLGLNPANNGGTFVGWPCAILFGGKSQAAVGLPGDVKNSGWRILMPPSVPVVVRSGDILTDDLGKRYAVEGAEQSDIGWRINAQEVHP
ncbi:hypothetical protein ACJBUE_12780 [Ralstonia syzygii subsp. celebesensis]|uniref:Uncharacterized protein n=2 Tax=Ralstonia syzygii subsp. celebesensis TaxID=1310168 RepID=A0A1U9VDS5_9RALS|nr:hypothetical protein [Ralstonia syzygii]AQW28645.1 hypothetical protein B0B51_00465 [blood disease bacterium A2-HR MARDI]CCA82210.1 conserved hypothetical protein [blood disease bacterium R229]